MTNEDNDNDSNNSIKSKVNAPPSEAFQLNGKILNDGNNDKQSLFSQLPIRSKSRLFDFAGSNSRIASETNFSQSTWLQEEHQSTLQGGGGCSNIFPNDESQKEDKPKSSLFGAIMKFSSNIKSSSFSSSSSSYKGLSQTHAEGKVSRNDNPTTTDVGGISSLLTSPSGKSIMNLVNRFNSPFKFQSPRGPNSNNKKRRRRQLWGDDDADGDSFTTPTSGSQQKKRKRRSSLEMIDDEDDGSNIHRTNILFPENHQDGSRSSLYGHEADRDWQEAPIYDANTNDSANTRIEIRDWSLPTKIRMELHGISSSNHSNVLQESKIRQQQQQSTIESPSWFLDMLRDNEDVMKYWEYRSVALPKSGDGSVTTASTSDQARGLLRRNSTSTKDLQQQHTGQKALSRQNSLNNINGTNNELVDKSTTDLAKHLIQSVRGVRAKYSRSLVMEDNWEHPVIRTLAVNRERSQRHWQQSIRSLFLNYHRQLDLLIPPANRSRSLFTKSVVSSRYQNAHSHNITLNSYFYCIGCDHSVLFRADLSNEDNKNDGSIYAIPVVLISSTSDSFRKKLEENGLNTNDNNNFQLLESIEERNAREKLKIAAAAKKSKSIAITDISLLSPTLKADLEALRKAQAYGESAGADITVQLKKPSIKTQDDCLKSNLSKAVRISGWDNVSLFFEVYVNEYGAVNSKGSNDNDEKIAPTKSRLPMLICRHGLGPFQHASSKNIRSFPVEKENVSENSASRTNAIDICGILLPCAIRQLLLVARNQILEEETQKQLNGDEEQNSHQQQNSSRYVVLNSSRTNKPLSDPLMFGLNETLVFNQGRKKKDSIFECPNGKVISMALWDTSREEVAACKIDDAFPDIGM